MSNCRFIDRRQYRRMQLAVCKTLFIDILSQILTVSEIIQSISRSDSWYANQITNSLLTLKKSGACLEKSFVFRKRVLMSWTMTSRESKQRMLRWSDPVLKSPWIHQPTAYSRCVLRLSEQTGVSGFMELRMKKNARFCWETKHHGLPTVFLSTFRRAFMNSFL